MAAAYRVVPGTSSVALVKPSYTSEEEVQLHIVCQLQRRNGLGAWALWSSDYKIYDNVGNLIASDSRSHSMEPFTEIDTALDDFIIGLGKFSPGTLVGKVSIGAHG